MKRIILKSIEKNGSTLTYDFEISVELEKYFSGERLVIEYPVDISGVPDAVAAVPFVCNVLPIVWLTNCKLFLPELDESFFECIPEVKNGYVTMYPESKFSGEVFPDRVVNCDVPTGDGCAVFFSGGMDATQTLVSHFDENPHLISIWGADIRYDNVEGWNIVHRGIAETSRRFSLPDVVIRSTFRNFDNEYVLHKEFAKQLKDDWWHGIKHALGLLGHAAPLVYLNKISTIYIASSYCPADGVIRCASSPLTDNYVRFAGCQVVHDGYEFSRQDKAKNLVSFCNRTGRKITLHACWQSQTGSNCCVCEKCYRTMTALIAEGADPVEYGFENAAFAMENMRYSILERNRLSKHLAEHFWVYIQERIVFNLKLVKKSRYWKDIKWMRNADFAHFEKVKMPMTYRVRVRLSKQKWYQWLSVIKDKLIG